jgi:hypothetical protein
VPLKLRLADTDVTSLPAPEPLYVSAVSAALAKPRLPSVGLYDADGRGRVVRS